MYTLREKCFLFVTIITYYYCIIMIITVIIITVTM